jgi:FkbM family methyltransferase
MMRTFIAAKLHRIRAILWRVLRKCDKVIIHAFLPFLVKPQSGGLTLRRLGTDYGGWTVPMGLLNERSICYCVGVGIDASFDFALVDMFKCRVFSFDPTPKAITYMERQQYDRTRLSFLPIGVWDKDTKLRFFAPANPAETSHSVFDLHGTGSYFLAECRKLSSIMHQQGHDHIDLLKLDIEGAWRNVIENIVEERINISILCVELDSPTTIARVLWVIRALASIGLVLVHFEKDNYLFVQKKLLSQSVQVK